MLHKQCVIHHDEGKVRKDLEIDSENKRKNNLKIVVLLSMIVVRLSLNSFVLISNNPLR